MHAVWQKISSIATSFGSGSLYGYVGIIKAAKLSDCGSR